MVVDFDWEWIGELICVCGFVSEFEFMKVFVCVEGFVECGYWVELCVL